MCASSKEHLLHDGQWTLVNYAGDTSGEGEACVSHTCDRTTFCCCHSDKCPQCGEAVPIKLIGMKNLVEWER
jgi:hypothetical protein